MLGHFGYSSGPCHTHSGCNMILLLCCFGSYLQRPVFVSVLFVSGCLSVCLCRCLSLSLSISGVYTLSHCIALPVCLCSLCASLSLNDVWHVFIWRCEHPTFVWKFSCLTFHSLIHAYMYINNPCNLISTHQQLSKGYLLDRFLTEPKLQSL